MAARPPRRPSGKADRSRVTAPRGRKSGPPPAGEGDRSHVTAPRGRKSGPPPAGEGDRSRVTAPRGRKSGPPPAGEARIRRGEDWLYGRHAVIAALRNPERRAERLILTAGSETALAEAGVRPPLKPEIRTFQEITALLPEGAVHQGFALRANPLPPVHLETWLQGLAKDASAIALVLDQVTDPRNVGAVLRSAAAFGAGAVILPERHGADTTAALAKAASGALETVTLVRVTNVARALEALKAAGFWTVGLAARAPEVLGDVDLSGRIALVLGAEGAGLRRLVAETCDIRARLPISEAMESLNVSAAAACALYEVARRRT